MASQALSTNPIALTIRHDRQVGIEHRTVDARDLHGKLQVGRDFSTWIRSRIEEYDFVQGTDFEIIEDLSSPDLGSSKSRAQATIEYALTTTMAKELAMVERSDIGRAVRRYFIAAEQRLRELEAEVSRAETYSTDHAKLRVVKAVQAEVGEHAAMNAYRLAELPDLKKLRTDLRPGEEPSDAVKRCICNYLSKINRATSFDELFCSATKGAVNMNQMRDIMEDLVFEREVIIEKGRNTITTYRLMAGNRGFFQNSAKR